MHSPKLIAEKIDHDESKTKKLINLFHQEQILGNSKILLEKLPINNFRLEFIEEAFPNAKYIYLHRNGMEVAKSIEKFAEKRNWFGENSIKWDLIKKLSSKLNISEKINGFSNFEKGLLEWKFSLEFSEAFFSKLDKRRYYSLSYQTFLENPKLQTENIYKFLNLEFSDDLITQITKGIKRKSENIQNMEDNHLDIGGLNLKLSIENRLIQTAPDTMYTK